MKHVWKDYKVSDLIITIWLLISISLLCRLIYTQIQFNRFLLVLVPDNSKEIRQVYQSVQNNRKCKLKIYIIHGINSPCITGLIHPKILLPQIEFTQKELHYILQHELQHYYHHDLWLNMLCEIIMCFYWWNPLAYLLKERFRDMLEFANDQKITESMNEIEVYEYLECILKIIKTNKIHKKLPAICFIGCGRSTFQQRFDLITRSQQKKYESKGYILYSMIFAMCYVLSFAFAFEPRYTRPHQKPKEAIYELEKENTFFVKSKQGYKIYHDGKFVGRCKSLETFQGYKVYQNDKEAKENEEIK